MMPQLAGSQRTASAVRRAAADPATALVGSPAPGPASRAWRRVGAHACGATSADSSPTRRGSRSACGTGTALRRQSSEGRTRGSTPSACGLAPTRITSPPTRRSMHRQDANSNSNPNPYRNPSPSPSPSPSPGPSPNTSPNPDPDPNPDQMLSVGVLGPTQSDPRLACFMQTAARRPVTIGALGGSITAGSAQHLERNNGASLTHGGKARQCGQSPPLAAPQLGSCASSLGSPPAHWPPRHGLGCSSEPPPMPPISSPRTSRHGCTRSAWWRG